MGHKRIRLDAQVVKTDAVLEKEAKKDRESFRTNVVNIIMCVIRINELLMKLGKVMAAVCLWKILKMK